MGAGASSATDHRRLCALEPRNMAGSWPLGAQKPRKLRDRRCADASGPVTLEWRHRAIDRASQSALAGSRELTCATARDFDLYSANAFIHASS